MTIEERPAEMHAAIFEDGGTTSQGIQIPCKPRKGKAKILP